MSDPLMNDTDRRMQSRREHPRARVEWPVTVISAQSTIQGKAVNISRGGAFIHLSQPLELGDAVRLAFEIPDYQDAIVAKGEVLRAFPLKKEAEEKLSHVAAVKFTEISEQNLKYFTGNLAPEWKDDYIDSGPIETGENSKKKRRITKNRNTSILPWFLVLILLLPLSYFVYDSIQQSSADRNLISQLEDRLRTIEAEDKSRQNSLDSLPPLEGQLIEIQSDVENLKKNMVSVEHLERMQSEVVNLKKNMVTIDALETIQSEVIDLKKNLVTVDSLERIATMIENQQVQIQAINQIIETYKEVNSTDSNNDSPKNEEQFYVVQRGDTLFQISSNNEISVQELKEINNIGSSDAIFPGQKLKIK